MNSSSYIKVDKLNILTNNGLIIQSAEDFRFHCLYFIYTGCVCNKFSMYYHQCTNVIKGLISHHSHCSQIILTPPNIRLNSSTAMLVAGKANGADNIFHPSPICSSSTQTLFRRC